jgi:uncharacterized protein (TIGR03435 family)
MKRLFSVLLVSVGFVFVAPAQTQPSAARPTFEVASIHPSAPNTPGGVSGGCHGIDSKYGPRDNPPPLGRCVITNGRLSHLMGTAFQLKTMQMIKNAPDWVCCGQERFDVQAKAENQNSTEAQLLAMLQTLLEDRFKLKYHREDHEESGYALVVTKTGPKFTEAKDDEVQTFGPFNKENPTVTIAPKKISMEMLASFLSNFATGNVKDETGLPGFYDFKLTWNEAEGPSVFTAVQQQLGLRLDPRKVTVSYIVIESAQRPGDN